MKKRVMKHRMLTGLLLIVAASSAGCAYRYYLGMHGPSIRNAPEIHDASIKNDAQCLGCHSPEKSSSDAPATTHPHFKGCLKCHDDPVSK
jgi:hypothetical protein